MNRLTRKNLILASAFLLAALLAPACGGGGGSGGTIVPTPLAATFTADPSVPTPADPGTIHLVPMARRGAAGATFSIDVNLAGDVDRFFGLAFTLDVPTGVFLLGSTEGDVFQGSAMQTVVTAEQDPVSGIVSVLATQVQGGTFDPGVNIPPNTSVLVMTLDFNATVATTGPITFPGPPDRELDQCDIPSETCPPVADGALTFAGGVLVVQ